MALLLPGERALWQRMSGPDRRHAVGVAQDTVEGLGGGEPSREVIAAALLHDVGKVEARLGTFSRVGVTLAAMAAGRTRVLAWAGSTPEGGRVSLRHRIGLYLAHDQVGEELLRAAGSHVLTVTWAREHHLEPARWTVDAKLGAALKAADGD